MDEDTFTNILDLLGDSCIAGELGLLHMTVDKDRSFPWGWTAICVSWRIKNANEISEHNWKAMLLYDVWAT